MRSIDHIHGDLHLKNIFIEQVPPTDITYHIGTTPFKITGVCYAAKIFDFDGVTRHKKLCDTKDNNDDNVSDLLQFFRFLCYAIPQEKEHLTKLLFEDTELQKNFENIIPIDIKNLKYPEYNSMVKTNPKERDIIKILNLIFNEYINTNMEFDVNADKN